MRPRVLVRPPSPAFREALSSRPDRGELDPARALQQHAGFVRALEASGVDVVQLPPEPALADAPFVSDVLVCFPAVNGARFSLAVLARPGAPSRRPEVTSVAACSRDILPKKTELFAIREPGTLDGGDVLTIGDRVAIGVSARTNEDGALQLASAVARAGYVATLCPVEGRLHLASEVTVVNDRLVIGTRAGLASLDARAVLAKDVQRLVVGDADVEAANVLSLGGTCFVVSGHPRATAMLRDAGIGVVEVDLGEIVRADAGPTCLVSILP